MARPTAKLHSAAGFELIDEKQPADRISDNGHDGEQYAYPRELSAPRMFEDFFDDDPATVAAFWLVLNAKLSEAPSPRRVDKRSASTT